MCAVDIPASFMWILFQFFETWIMLVDPILEYSNDQINGIFETGHSTSQAASASVQPGRSAKVSVALMRADRATIARRRDENVGWGTGVAIQ